MNFDRHVTLMKTDLTQRDEILMQNILEIAQVMAALRNRDHGCPWDLEQTFMSIAPYTIEEAYEVADAIDRSNMQDLREELGDLLFQVVFHSQIASEQQAFDLADVAKGISRKMIERHPHVFARNETRSAAQQTTAWELQKAQERERKSADKSALAGVATALPSLKRAQKLQSRAARVGFDWPTLEGVMAKIQEEFAEVEEAVAANKADWIAEEVGDLLFSVVNLARKLDVDSETALRQANIKFECRFRAMEKNMVVQQQDISTLSLDQLELLWQQAKADEKAAKQKQE
jgi:nucleoside triphosphate diphosphatase